ncbi:MAG TPA: prepilin-type N-terminal cleavage/methylation domain-containing protein [Bacilli bacterium]|nr:prepilin-type N-terminal cleavage/methylation domain-containing protein [Bacilli bacterium]
MKKNKKGFTLIELLATILILGIIALIAIPLVLDVIKDASKNALKDSAYGLIDATDLYFAQNQSNLAHKTVFTIENNKLTSEEKIDYKGKVDEGTIILYSDGKNALCIDNGDYAAVKRTDETEVTLYAGTCGEENSTGDGFDIISSVEELTNRVKDLEDENATLKNTNNKLEEDNASCQGSLAELDAQIISLQNQISNLNAQIIELNNQINTLKGDKSSLQTQITNLTNEKTALQEQVTTLQNKIANVDGQLTTKTLSWSTTGWVSNNYMRGSATVTFNFAHKVVGVVSVTGGGANGGAGATGISGNTVTINCHGWASAAASGTITVVGY